MPSADTHVRIKTGYGGGEPDAKAYTLPFRQDDDAGNAMKFSLFPRGGDVDEADGGALMSGDVGFAWRQSAVFCFQIVMTLKMGPPSGI